MNNFLAQLLGTEKLTINQRKKILIQLSHAGVELVTKNLRPGP